LEGASIKYEIQGIHKGFALVYFEIFNNKTLKYFLINK
jgi:hypothetical protein